MDSSLQPLVKIIHSLLDRLPSRAQDIVKAPLTRYALGAWLALRLLRGLNSQLSRYTLNNYTTLSKFEPTNELAVVTGGSSGIGWQIMKDLSALNVRVVILDVQEPKGPLRKYEIVTVVHDAPLENATSNQKTFICGKNSTWCMVLQDRHHVHRNSQDHGRQDPTGTR